MHSELEQLIARAVNDADLAGSELPTIDLYMDQIISLVAKRNGESSPRYADRVLTKTMINNYSKEGLITPIKGKKYTREQVLQMLYINALKGTVSIGEVKRLLYGVYHDVPEFDGEELGRCYDRFLSLKQSNRENSVRLMEDLTERGNLHPENPEDYFLTVLGAVSLSAYFKAIAKELLENRYPDPNAEERARREAEEHARKQAEAAERMEKEKRKHKNKRPKEEKEVTQ